MLRWRRRKFFGGSKRRIRPRIGQVRILQNQEGLKYIGRKKSEFVADFTFSRYKAKILPTGVIDPEKTPRRKILRIRSLS